MSADKIPKIKFTEDLQLRLNACNGDPTKAIKTYLDQYARNSLTLWAIINKQMNNDRCCITFKFEYDDLFSAIKKRQGGLIVPYKQMVDAPKVFDPVLCHDVGRYDVATQFVILIGVVHPDDDTKTMSTHVVMHKDMVTKFKSACIYCGKFGATKKCSQCKSVHYCGKICQRAHWKVHKNVCKK